MNGYMKRTSQKKDAIIKASLQLFNLNGYTNTTIKDIASNAHVSQVSIYNYFGSKETIIYECAKYLLQDTIVKAEQILASSIPYIDKLQQALSLCSEDSAIAIECMLSDIAKNDPVFVVLLKKDFSQIKQSIFRKYIELGYAEQVIPPILSTDIILKFFDSLNNIELSMDSMQEDTLALHHLLLYGLIGS